MRQLRTADAEFQIAIFVPENFPFVLYTRQENPRIGEIPRLHSVTDRPD